MILQSGSFVHRILSTISKATSCHLHTHCTIYVEWLEVVCQHNKFHVLCNVLYNSGTRKRNKIIKIHSSKFVSTKIKSERFFLLLLFDERKKNSLNERFCLFFDDLRLNEARNIFPFIKRTTDCQFLKMKTKHETQQKFTFVLCYVRNDGKCYAHASKTIKTVNVFFLSFCKCSHWSVVCYRFLRHFTWLSFILNVNISELFAFEKRQQIQKLTLRFPTQIFILSLKMKMSKWHNNKTRREK